MKKIFIVVILAITSTYSDNNLIILNGEEDSDVSEIEIRGNGESCRISFESTGKIYNDSCRSMENSKGIRIYCTPKKKICKTYDEIYTFVFEPQSSSNNVITSFMDTPVSYFYPNGVEEIADKKNFYVTVSELVNLGLKKGETSWKELERGKHMLTLVQKDNFKGTTNILKMLFVVKNDHNRHRALMSRLIYNNEEITIRTGLTNLLKRFVYGASHVKKLTKNPNYVEDRRKEEHEKLMKDIERLRKSSNYYN